MIRLIFSSSSADLSSLTGQNLKFLMDKYNKSDMKSLISDRNLIKKSRVNPLPEEESWKVKLLQEICLARKELIEVDFDDKDLEEILEFVCTG